jgi:hypothetical protein
MSKITSLRGTPAAPAGLDPEMVARAAFSIAEAEGQAKFAGLDAVPLAAFIEVAEKCGGQATAFAMSVRGDMLLAEADELARLARDGGES